MAKRRWRQRRGKAGRDSCSSQRGRDGSGDARGERRRRCGEQRNNAGGGASAGVGREKRRRKGRRGWRRQRGLMI
ncbi:hypothetical protein AHAS_Ahas12G0098200 [Arachis hypogaea]